MCCKSVHITLNEVRATAKWRGVSGQRMSKLGKIYKTIIHSLHRISFILMEMRNLNPVLDMITGSMAEAIAKKKGDLYRLTHLQED